MDFWRFLIWLQVKVQLRDFQIISKPLAGGFVVFFIFYVLYKKRKSIWLTQIQINLKEQFNFD